MLPCACFSSGFDCVFPLRSGVSLVHCSFHCSDLCDVSYDTFYSDFSSCIAKRGGFLDN